MYLRGLDTMDEDNYLKGQPFSTKNGVKSINKVNIFI